MNYRVRQIIMGLHPSALPLSRKGSQREAAGETKYDKETTLSEGSLETYMKLCSPATVPGQTDRQGIAMRLLTSSKWSCLAPSFVPLVMYCLSYLIGNGCWGCMQPEGETSNHYIFQLICSFTVNILPKSQELNISQTRGILNDSE